MLLRKIGYDLGKLQTRKPWMFIALAVAMTLLALPGIPILLGNVEPSLEKVLPQEIEEVKVMNDMRSQYGADMLYLVVTSQDDVLTPEMLRYMDQLSQSLRQVENVLEVRSPSDAYKMAYGAVPLTQREIDSLASTGEVHMVSHERTVAYIMIRSDTGSDADAVQRVIDDIEFTMLALDSSNPGLDITITGFNAIDNATFKVIIDDFTKITLVSFGLMVVFLLLHYRFSIKKTVYSMVIMVLSLIWALGTTGYLGIELNVVTMVSAAMIMALGSSYGINSVYHFYDDFLLQYDKNEAIAKFQEFLIVGLIGSALAEIAGFAALLFGIMPSMHSLGIILAIGIFFALFASVIVLPVLFYLMEQDNTKRRRV